MDTVDIFNHAKAIINFVIRNIDPVIAIVYLIKSSTKYFIFD